MSDLPAVKTTNSISTLKQVENQGTKASKQTIILGVGNELLGDKGIGLHAVRQLKQVGLPPNARIVEVGTAILDALIELKHAGRIIILDAIKNGGTPGTVYRIPLDRCNGSPGIVSIEGFDLFRVMAVTGRKEPLPIIVFGVEPDEVGRSIALSPTVAKSLPCLIEAVRKELRN